MSHSLMHASVMREAAFCAAVTWKLLSGNFNPPAKKEQPNTRSKLERMEPSNCVKMIWSAFSVTPISMT